MLSKVPISHLSLSRQSIVARLQNLHLHRTLSLFPNLAPPTQLSSTVLNTSATSTNTFNLRAQQVARHFTTTFSQNVDMSQLPISEKGYHSKAPGAYSVRKIAPANTLEHRIFIEKDGVPVSPFHDIPLYANEQQTILNMVVEIPRWSNGKLEVSTSISEENVLP